MRIADFISSSATLRALLLCAIATASSLHAFPARAQDPGKPIRLIIPLAPGGAIDVVARRLAQVYTERTGQSVIVDNKPGGNTIIAADACAHAAPDGNTLCLLSDSTTSLNPGLYSKLPYDVSKGFEPVTQLAFAPQVLVMNPSVPVATTTELIGYSKANPQKINYASFGTGSNGQLVVEWLKKKTGADLTHVPYKGGAPVTMALASGEVQLALMLIGNPGIVSQINAGQLKGLMVTGQARNPLIPSVPTFGEAGFPMNSQLWFGIFAPGGTPKEVVQKLNGTLADIIRSADFKARQLAPNGFIGVGNGADEFARFVREDALRGRELVKISGVVLD